MKIGILTLPLHTNYGGLLQALALQTVLEYLGNKVIIINREYPKKKCPLFLTLKESLKQLLDKYVYNYKITSFVSDNYHKSRELNNDETFSKYIKESDFDAIIVGSDQVWRPQYSPNIFNYYLDVTEGMNMKRISYAASFGVDEWEYSHKETEKCSILARLFDAISVREKSGIKLCKEYLGVNACLVLDPTMLLNKEYYIALTQKYKEPMFKGNLFCYVLDNDAAKNNLISTVINELGLRPFYCSDPHGREIRPSVTQWIRGFMDADMIVTDSFHGTVFSIIFNKPFWVIGNERRGLSRFESLLKLFGLENRLIQTDNPVDLKSQIDWDGVNARINEMRSYSLTFLKNALSN